MRTPYYNNIIMCAVVLIHRRVCDEDDPSRRPNAQRARPGRVPDTRD